MIYPDQDETASLGQEELEAVMEQNRENLNEMLPNFSRISRVILRDEEFMKTPKKSIKRYLYHA